MTTETTQTKLTRMHKPPSRKFLVLPQVPDAAQTSGHGHIQIRIGTGYVSTDMDLYDGRVTPVQRAEVKLARLKAIEETTQTSYSGGDRKYAPLDVVDAGPGKGGTLQIAGVPVVWFLVDPGVSLEPAEHQGPFSMDDQDQDQDQDESDDQDQDDE
jgi:hypothetical protein